ncbi:MAG TPA: winged helix-turn-helix domain-containing protein, partial [Spirochaetia bacterium]|nr:winged helix-turn-helix domain-containing protein [Spirochaetia bacterium]
MKYEEIYVELQKQFAQGKWKPGQRLPTERELSQHYGVSRPTISRVLSRLRDAGQIRRVAGAGTFVTDAGEDDGLKHQTFALL